VVDPAAASVVEVMEPRSGETVLDLCAAPGGKTMLMAQKMHNKGGIYATDIDGDRLGKIADTCARLGVEIVAIVGYESLPEIARDRKFDAVLADVPCSNSGVMARRAEVRYRITEEAVKQLAVRQLAILEHAAGLIRPGGRIVYSTCSILREENQEVVERFVSHHSDFEFEREFLMLPRPETAERMESDGGFAAVIRRKK
jgi:16S rRNA (cytosine967-C5)-methyltransferase